MNQFNQTEVYKIHEIIFSLDNLAHKNISKNTKITYIQFLILLAISENPDFSQAQIGNWVNLTKSAVSQQVEKLVKLELLIRTENKNDRREKDIKLTKEGQQQLEKATQIADQISESLLTVLTKSDRDSLQKILDQLVSKGLPKLFQN
jgi:DNA-binding MarR family transcriptional regulator